MPSCNLMQFISGIEFHSDINMIFEKSDINVRVHYYNPSEKLDELKYIFENEAECSHTITKNDVPLIVKQNKKIIALLILNVYEKCIYIGYQCVISKYRGQGWGQFLTFLAIFFAQKCGFDFVFSMGVSDMKIKSTNKRVGDYNFIDVSQYMNIKTFGFEDFYDVETYTMERMRKFGSYCGADAETVLDLRLGNLMLYEKYKRSFVDHTSIHFAKFLQ